MIVRGFLVRRPTYLSGSIAALTAILLGASAPLAPAKDWTAATSNDWFTAGNWNPATVPTSADAVNINLGGAHFSLINQAGAQAVSVDLASIAATTGELHVTGPGTLTIGGANGLTVGDFGAGTVIISGGGQLTTPYLLMANNFQSHGSIQVTGANSLLTVGNWDAAYDVNTVVTVSIEAGAHFNLSGYIQLANFDPSSSATLTVTGSGSNFTTTANTFSFGIGVVGHGTLNVENGATAVTNRIVSLASGASSQGTVLVDGTGSSWTTGNLLMGSAGVAQMTISNGGSVVTQLVTPGPTASLGRGTVNVTGAGSSWTIGGVPTLLALTMGNATTPSNLNVQNGGSVSVLATATNFSQADVRVGSTGTANILVDGAGSTFSTPYNFYVGYGSNAKGTVTVQNGGTLNTGFAVIGLNSDSSSATADSVAVTGAGSTWTIADTPGASAQGLTIGSGGIGSLTVAAGGTVHVTDPAALVILGGSSASQGTLNIGAANGSSAAAPGTLQVSSVVFSSSSSGPLTINFNHTSNSYTFSPQISGGTGIVNVLAGTTILTATNTYAGQTNVLGGTLYVDGSLGNTAVTIGSGATLGGTGTLSRFATQLTTLQSGGIISPGHGLGSVGTLSAYSLMWDSGGKMAFDLGPNTTSDRLVLNGAFNGDGGGNYIFNFNFDPNDPSIIGKTFVLVNFGSTNFTAGSFPTATQYQVGNEVLLGGFILAPNSLQFKISGEQALGDQYWDGTNTTANGTVDGGSGTWDLSTTNWTNVVGSINAAWGGGTAYFTKTGGTVTLGNNITFGGMTFEASGYVIAPDGGGLFALTPATGAVILADADATISAKLTGNGSLIKNGAGALTLSNAGNDYSGGTTLNAGSLIAGSDAAFGSGTLIINGGTLGSITGSPALTRTLNNPLMINGSFATTQDSSFRLQGDAVLTHDVTITNKSAAGKVVFAGAMTGAGNLTLTSTSGGEFDFVGSKANTYAGTTTVDSVVLGLGKTGGVLAIPGDITITGTGVVDLAFGVGEQIADSATVTVNSGGAGGRKGFELHGQTETIGTLNGSASGTVGLGNGKLIVSAGNFAGVISDGATGSGGQLVKTGAGTLTLSGANTYTGSTTVDGGTLFVDGSITSPTTTISAAGILGGTGTVGGILINNGLVSPGHSPGTLTVSGNYVQNSSGNLRIEIGGRNPGEYDVLAIGGSASLSGGLQVLRLNNFQLQAGDHIVFLTAAGGVSGTFASGSNDFATGTAVSGKVVYETKGVALVGVQESFATVSKLIAKQFPKMSHSFPQLRDLTPNQQAVANELDTVLNDSREAKLIAYLDRRLLPELPGDFDRIAPEELTAIYQSSISLATIQSLNLQRRTDDLRRGTNGFSAAGFAINGETPGYSGGFDITSGVAGPSGDPGKDSKEVYVSSPDNRWGVFLSGTGEWLDIDSDGNGSGYNVTTGGFTLGVDYKASQHFALGLSFGYAGTDADLAGGGRIRINGGKLGLYATYFTGGFYTDIAINGGYNSYDTRRSALQGDARGSTDGGELNALFGTGYDFKKGALTFGPTASFNYTYVGMSDFTEHGSLAPLNVHGGSGQSLRTALGAKVSYDWKLGGVLIKPELRAEWQHEFGDAAHEIGASLASGAGNSFVVDGSRLGRDSLLLGGGFAIQLSERCATYVYYDGELGRRNYQSSAVTGGFRFSF